LTLFVWNFYRWQDIGGKKVLSSVLDPGGQKLPTKVEHNSEISCSLLRAEGFFCSLEILYGALGIGKLLFLI
jgi:hypothetical protein